MTITHQFSKGERNDRLSESSSNLMHDTHLRQDLEIIINEKEEESIRRKKK